MKKVYQEPGIEILEVVDIIVTSGELGGDQAGDSSSGWTDLD